MKKVYEFRDIKKLIAEKEGCSINDIQEDRESDYSICGYIVELDDEECHALVEKEYEHFCYKGVDE